mmetsp:Transcript_66744/g.211246  ORF Transcript_66744/g.211246 Transcript_66744/m.211246 type:complete len:259 (+) Transcript_66744:459-1235(+)
MRPTLSALPARSKSRALRGAGCLAVVACASSFATAASESALISRAVLATRGAAGAASSSIDILRPFPGAGAGTSSSSSLSSSITIFFFTPPPPPGRAAPAPASTRSRDPPPTAAPAMSSRRALARAVMSPAASMTPMAASMDPSFTTCWSRRCCVWSRSLRSLRASSWRDTTCSRAAPSSCRIDDSSESSEVTRPRSAAASPMSASAALALSSSRKSRVASSSPTPSGILTPSVESPCFISCSLRACSSDFICASWLD